MQSTSDLDYFHARDLPCSRVKSRDDPFSGFRGDSAVPYCSVYIDITDKLLTFSFALYLLGMSVFTARFLLMLLTLATLVEVLHDDSDEHVEHKEADK